MVSSVFNPWLQNPAGKIYCPLAISLLPLLPTEPARVSNISMHRTFIVFLASFLAVVSAQAADTAKPLAPVAAQALANGTDATLNPFFQRSLGVAAEEGRPLALKRLRDVQGNKTNYFDISVADKQTIIITAREGALSHYFLTDLSGTLQKAVVNDARNRSRGVTNVPNAVAQEPFERAKQGWLAKFPAKP